MDSNFEWDNDKNVENQDKHHVSFVDAQYAFLDSDRVIFEDVNHSDIEPRFYCLGKNKEGSGILTVRFTYRRNRIIGERGEKFMKKKIIYSDDFLSDDVKVRIVKDFLPSPNDLVLKKDFRNRFEVQIDSMSQKDFRQAAVA